jgi:tyrosyl-tRNA synthetase
LVQDLAAGANPRDSKASLAREIVRLYHGEKAAGDAEEHFNRVFVNKNIPSTVPDVDVGPGKEDWPVWALVMDAGLAESGNQAKALVEQGGVKLNNEVMLSNKKITIKDGDILQVGKRRFVRLKVK